MIYPDEFERYWKDNKEKLLKQDSLLSEKVVKAVTFEKWARENELQGFDFPSYYRRVKVAYACPFFIDNKCFKEGSKFFKKECPHKGEMNECEEVRK